MVCVNTDGLCEMVRVKLFASLREAKGWSERVVSPDLANATPLALWRQLELASAWREAHGAMAAEPSSKTDGDGLPNGVRVAINQHFASPHTPLNDGDELAFLPPITGG